MERRDGIAILTMSGDARAVDGRNVGVLPVPEGCSSEAWIAPDGGSVAWIYTPPVDYPAFRAETTIRVDTRGTVTRTIRCPALHAKVVAISSGAETAVIAAWSTSGAAHSLLAFGRTGGTLTEMLDRLSIRAIERLQLSGDGRLLAVGSRETVTLIDIPGRKLLFSTNGRFPSVSPDGTSLAFVDSGQRLLCRNLKDETIRQIAVDGRVLGTGAWSPDGRYLLAGIQPSLGESNLLTVVDVTREQSAVAFPLGEGDYGGQCAWIHMSFLRTA